MTRPNRCLLAHEDLLLRKVEARAWYSATSQVDISIDRVAVGGFQQKCFRALKSQTPRCWGDESASNAWPIKAVCDTVLREARSFIVVKLAADGCNVASWSNVQHLLVDDDKGDQATK